MVKKGHQRERQSQKKKKRERKRKRETSMTGLVENSASPREERTQGYQSNPASNYGSVLAGRRLPSRHG